MEKGLVLFNNWTEVEKDFYTIPSGEKPAVNQGHTNATFTDKWEAFSKEELSDQEKLSNFQKNWFLKLYGFDCLKSLSDYLQNFEVILDAGCGLGYKSAWLASLAPESTIIGIDYSGASYIGYQNYSDKFDNLIFAHGDIAATQLPNECISLTICDQVIMHTEDPRLTLQELSRVTQSDGEVWCYWYRKKALPRELLDDYFRAKTVNLTNEELWKLSEEVLSLGKVLAELNVSADFPDLPTLGIKGGKMDLQRYIYWNFIKCFWNEDLGYVTSLSTNFDWYSPVNAKRFSKADVQSDLHFSSLSQLFFHEEEACYSGRFKKE